MYWVALRMLMGDTTKYLGIVFGVCFATLLMAQQTAIFCGLMRNTTGQIRDLEGADIWVMDRSVQFVDDVKPMSENRLLRVRGVEGVSWAVKLYKGIARAKLPNGQYQQVILLGLDYDNRDEHGQVVGQPRHERILAGQWSHLDQPDTVFMDDFGWRYMFGPIPFEEGRTIEMNNKLARVVGLVKCSATFQTFPILYTKYSQALQYIPPEPKTLSFILVKAKPAVNQEELCRRIGDQTGMLAHTNDGFFWMTISYYLRRTGIPINFGITVGLGFVVGCAIAGQTFYLFTIENLKQFGSLKAMGVSNGRIIRMVLLQAAVVGLIGYGLGIGGAAGFGIFFERAVTSAPPAFYFGWQIPALAAGAVAVIILVSAAVSLKRVLFLEAGVVFR